MEYYLAADEAGGLGSRRRGGLVRDRCGSHITTWYSHARHARVDVTFDDGRRAQFPVATPDGRLNVDLDGVTDRIERIHVQWPSTFLIDYTLIDIPTPASLPGMISERTLNQVAQADVVIYSTSEPSPEDAKLLQSTAVRGDILGVLGIHSRTEFTPPTATVLPSLDRNFLPVSGLMALRGRTLRQNEFATFAQLAALPSAVLRSALVSESRFVYEYPSMTVSVVDRTELLDRFGLDGVRAALSIIAGGADDAAALASELVRRSGLEAVQHALQSQFGARHAHLAVHAAMRDLRRVLERHATAQSMYLLTEVDHLLDDDHGFRELEELAILRAGELHITEWQRAALEQALGGQGTSSRARLGLERDADDAHMFEAANSAVKYWRAQLENPVLDTKREHAYATATRSCEAILAERALVRF